MSITKTNALTSASVLILALGAAAAADAQQTSPKTLPATTNVEIYGGGATLIQPYLRQAEDCFGQPQATWDTSNPPAPTWEPAYVFTGTPAENCGYTLDSTNTVVTAITQAHPDFSITGGVGTGVTLQFQGTGSGAGVLGLFTHTATNFNSPYNYQVSGAGAAFPTVNYSASELPLGSNDVAVYDFGGTSIPTPGKSTNIYGSNNTSGAIANPLATYGALVQYPLLISPLTLAFNQVYMETYNASAAAGSQYVSYSFQLPIKKVTVGANKLSIPAVQLDATTYCEIFNGFITDWADPRIAALNGYRAKGGTALGGRQNKSGAFLQKGVVIGGVWYQNGATIYSLEDPNDPTPASAFSVPIRLMGRSDSSGATGIFTRHMQAECNKVAANFTAITNTADPSGIPTGTTSITSLYTSTGGVANPSSQLTAMLANGATAATTAGNGVTGNQYVAAALLPTALGASSHSKTNVTHSAGSGLFTTYSSSGALGVGLAFVAPSSSSATNTYTGLPTVIEGNIGYIGTDFVNPYSATPTGLYAAALQNNLDTQNNSGVPVYILPSPKSALAAFGSVNPPESNPDGTYAPNSACTSANATNTSDTNACRNHPWSWVEPLSATSPIATAGDTLSGAYPLTGTSNLIAYTCYADKDGVDSASVAGTVNTVGLQLNQFLAWYNTNGLVVSKSNLNLGVLAARGFADLPANWKLAVKQTFIAPTTTTTPAGTVDPQQPATNALELWVSPMADVTTLVGNNTKVLFAHNPACNVSGVTGA